MARAFICGCSSTVLTADEEAFIRDSDPWGLILFKRNVLDREQMRALTDRFRETRDDRDDRDERDEREPRGRRVEREDAEDEVEVEEDDEAV